MFGCKNLKTTLSNYISPLLLCLVIANVLLLRLTNANCSHQFFFREENLSPDIQDKYHQNLSWTFLEDTKQCDDELSSLLSNGNFSDPPRLEQQLYDQQLLTVAPCVDQLFDIDLTPISVFPVGKNILPYVQLNITVNTFSSVDQLFLRFRCIYAPNYDDYLCHNHSIQLKKWGQMIWPCRKFQIDRNQHFSVPKFHFSYTCFRLFSLSQYYIEFFVLNRNELCRRELLFTIPMEQQLDPKIANFYNAIQWDRGTSVMTPSWSPLVAVDTSFSDCLFVQLHPSEWLIQDQQYRPKAINVAVFSTDDNENNKDTTNDNNRGSRNKNKIIGNAISIDGDEQRQHNNGQQQQIMEDDQQQKIIVAENDHSPQQMNKDKNLTLYGNNRLKYQFRVSHKVPFLGRNENANKHNDFYRWAWIDVDAGNYTLFAFVEQGDCHLTCIDNHENGQQQQQKCHVCPHTALNFTLTAAKHSVEFRRSMLMTALARNANFCVLGVLFFLLIALVVAFLYVRVWRPRALARLPPHHVELDNCCPTVLVLYTDDCQEHSDAVLALCRTLEESANAKCFVDQWAFEDNPTLRPSLWLVEKLAECDFVLVIFSACSVRVLAGEQLVQRRHFPDLFNSGLGFIVARIREIASSEGVILPEHHHHHPQIGQPTKIPPKCASPKRVPAKCCHRDPSPKICAAIGKSLLNRFIFARFACADPSVIPPFFASSQFGVCRAGGGPLVLPDQIGLLIARLHGVVKTTTTMSIPIDAKKGQNNHRQPFLHEADLNELNNALERLRQFMETNPNWMEQRFIKTQNGQTEDKGAEDEEGNGGDKVEKKGSDSNSSRGTDILPRHAPQHLVDGTENGRGRAVRVPTIDEQGQIAAHYGLLTVEDEYEEDEEDTNGQKKQTTEVTKGANSKRYQLLMVGEEEEEEQGEEKGEDDDEENVEERQTHWCQIDQ